MRKLKFISCVLFLFLICLNSKAQSLWRINRDSIIRILPTLHDSTRVNSLNVLSIYYILKGNKDSGLYYTGIAKKESEKLNYVRGMAESSTSMGAIEFDYNYNLSQAEKLLKDALQLLDKTTDKGNIGFTYYKLGHTLHTEGKYREAIANYNHAISSFHLAQDWTGIGRTLNSIGRVYMENGDYDSAFNSLKEGLDYAKKNNTALSTSYDKLGNFYREVTDYETALEYHRLWVKTVPAPYDSIEYFNQLGLTFGLNHQYDSAKYYFTKSANKNPENRETKLGIGEILLAQGEFDKALINFAEPYSYYRKIKFVNDEMRLLLDISRAQTGKGDYSEAFHNSRGLLKLAEKTNARQYLRDAYLLLSSLFEKSGNGDSAYFYLKKYTDIRDSVISKQILWRINNFKKEAEKEKSNATITLLQKDNDIKKQQLIKESIIRNIFIFGILAMGLFAFIIFRYISLKRKSEKQRRESAENELRIEKLENEKEQNILKHKTAELEMLALRKENEKELMRNQMIANQKVELEEQVTKRTVELKQSLIELKSTQAQLIQSEKMASLGELTAGIAHEIQNPLNFVNNFSEVNKELLAELKDEINKGNISDANAIADDVIGNEEKINHHGKRADAIVKGMLQHSKTSSGQKELTDINALAEEYLRLSYHGMRAKDKSFNAELNTNFDNSIGKINIVPQDIGRVLLNLYNNAFYAINEKRKAADENYQPTVSVKTKKINARPPARAGSDGDDGVERDKVEITVKDNGNGIPQNIVDKIFQPFFTTKPTGEGTGLGLSLSYDIIKAHGGEIKVEKSESEGTEFIIQLTMA